MPLVKNVFVRIKVDGAAQAKADMADLAERARAIGKMDPTINVKVDAEGMLKLRAMQLELRALGGDAAGLRGLAARVRAIGDAAESPRAKLVALALEMEAVKRAAKADADAIDGDGGGGGLLASLKRLFNWGAGGNVSTAAGGIPGVPAGLPVPVIIAGLIAGLSALPFLAQAAAGAITLGLGGALAGIGIYAAAQFRSVKYQFAQLSASAQADFVTMGQAFRPALTAILRVAREVLPGIAKTFDDALQPIRGPLKAIGEMLVRTFADKQVADSIKAIGAAFGSILSALTPMLPGMFASVADGITNIARAVAKNPKAIADMISGLVHLIGVALDVIAWLTQVADYLEMHFIPAFDRSRHDIAQWAGDVRHFFDNIRHDIAHWADDARRDFDRVRHDVAQWAGDVRRGFDRVRHDIARWLDDIRHGFGVFAEAQTKFGAFEHDIAWGWDRIRHVTALAWDWIRHVTATFLDWLRHAAASAFDWVRHTIASVFGWLRHEAASTFDHVRHTIATWTTDVFGLIGRVVGWFRALPGRIISALSSLPGKLFSAGQHAIQRLIDGLGSMLGALGNMAGKIASKIAGFFGLSPAIEGPLSGGGAPEIRGRHFAEELARGIIDGSPMIRVAAAKAAAIATRGMGAGFDGTWGLKGGPWQVPGQGGVLPAAPVVTIELRGDEHLIQWLKNQIRVRGGGGPQSVQRALGVVYR